MNLSNYQTRIVGRLKRGFFIFANSIDGDAYHNNIWLSKSCCGSKAEIIKKNTLKSLLNKQIVFCEGKEMMFYKFGLNNTVNV